MSVNNLTTQGTQLLDVYAKSVSTKSVSTNIVNTNQLITPYCGVASVPPGTGIQSILISASVFLPYILTNTNSVVVATQQSPDNNFYPIYLSYSSVGLEIFADYGSNTTTNPLLVSWYVVKF